MGEEWRAGGLFLVKAIRHRGMKVSPNKVRIKRRKAGTKAGPYEVR